MPESGSSQNMDDIERLPWVKDENEMQKSRIGVHGVQSI